MDKVLVDRELLAGLVSNDRETRLDAERRMYGVLANQPAEAQEEREAFERVVSVPDGIYWSKEHGVYRSMNGRENEVSEAYATTLRLEGWKSRAVRPAKAEPADAVEVSRFLTDVMTAAGLLSCGKRDRGLAEHLSNSCIKFRTGVDLSLHRKAVSPNKPQGGVGG